MFELMYSRRRFLHLGEEKNISAPSLNAFVAERIELSK